MKNQKGFTILELLIALVVFAVGILGVGAMQLSSIQGNSKGNHISEASIVAADRIERFLSLDYADSDLDDSNGDGDGPSQDLNGDGIDDNGGNFGLDELTAPDGTDDWDGDGVNDIFWNVAVDYPQRGVKTVKIFVDPPGGGKKVEMTILKSNL